MAPDTTDFIDLAAAWPEPVQLSHASGDSFVTMYLWPDYIEARWYGHLTADNVVAAANAYLSVMQKVSKPKLLNNKSDATGDWSEANDWLEFEWLPKAYQAGLRCMAHVYSNNMFSRLSSRDLIQRLAPHVKIRSFDNRATAEDWLCSCHVADEAI